MLISGHNNKCSLGMYIHIHDISSTVLTEGEKPGKPSVGYRLGSIAELA